NSPIWNFTVTGILLKIRSLCRPAALTARPAARGPAQKPPLYMSKEKLLRTMNLFTKVLRDLNSRQDFSVPEIRMAWSIIGFRLRAQHGLWAGMIYIWMRTTRCRQDIY